MTNPSVALKEHLINIGLDQDVDFLRESVQLLTQMVIELEAEEQIGADKHERTPKRNNQRNGYRKRNWETRVGEIELRIPKLRKGSFYPSLLEPRRRTEKALLAVVQQAYIEGVSTRKVDDLLKALGLTGIDKSKVSRICKELDEVVEQFRNRPLEGEYPYLWLDALYLKVRQNQRIVSMATVVAIGVDTQGRRHILGFALDFLRSLIRRGLKGVQLVISDAHEGLKAAINQVLTEATWQRCRVHFMRNVLAHVPKRDKALIAAAIRTVFAQPEREAAKQQLGEVIKVMHPRWPKAAQVLEQAEEDILAYMTFPQKHWTRIYSTNPLERLNKEVKRRTNVVGVFPDQPSVIRLVGSILMEIDDEWQAAERRYFSLETMRELTHPEVLLEDLGPLRLAPIH